MSDRSEQERIACLAIVAGAEHMEPGDKLCPHCNKAMYGHSYQLTDDRKSIRFNCGRIEPLTGEIICMLRAKR